MNVMEYKPEPPMPCKTRKPISSFSDLARPAPSENAPKNTHATMVASSLPIPSLSLAKITEKPIQFSTVSSVKMT